VYLLLYIRLGKKGLLRTNNLAYFLSTLAMKKIENIDKTKSKV